MQRTISALFLAAALVAGSLTAAQAEDEPTDAPPAYSQDGRRDHPRSGPRSGPRRDRRQESFRGGDRPDGFGGWCGPRSGYDSGPGRGPGGRHDDFRPDFGPDRFDPMGHGHFGFGRLEALDLDDAQRAKVVDILTENFRARLEAKLALTDARHTLDEISRDDTADEAAIIAAHAAVGEAEGRLKVLGRKVRTDIESILTPEQLERVAPRHPGRDGRGPRPGRRPGDAGRGPGGDRRPHRTPDAPQPGE
ncbi:MAG: periplasmic heavy metal sensor [Planctomycetes bacterium]|nr:periplasmic heavy metal sensor [Planctomycetota bacterium]